jgi:hypothetical protein
MKLLLHAGPMKTGSTAFQDLLSRNQGLLAERGIRFRWLQRHYLNHLAQVLEEERRHSPAVLLVSHECLCRSNPNDLQSLLSQVSGTCQAFLVARPLCELYPSLYLQNLKGHVMRTTSFEDFLVEQKARDRFPEQASKGQVFDFAYLQSTLEKAGCDVSWVRFSKDNLLRELVRRLSQLAGVPLLWEELVPPPPPTGLNPRRSLVPELADVACQLNKLCRDGAVSDSARQELLVALLNTSELVQGMRSGRDPLSNAYERKLDALDDEINGAFWRQFSDK